VSPPIFTRIGDFIVNYFTIFVSLLFLILLIIILAIILARFAKKKLRKEGFGDVRAIELIEREMLVKELGSRPDNKMIGHTAYLIFGRKV